MGLLEQTSPLVRAPAGVERDLVAVESRPSLDSLQEEEEDEDKEVCWFYSHYVEEHLGEIYLLARSYLFSQDGKHV